MKVGRRYVSFCGFVIAVLTVDGDELIRKRI